MRTMPEASVDAIVTDPPYHLTTGKKGGSGEASVNLDSPYGRSRIGTGFMGMKWDGGDIAQSVEMWREALRVLKPGGHLLAFSGSRTYHRMACAIEDAGFEIRDQIMWVYGSGFPKSLNVEKAISDTHGTAVDACQWQGWGTALKPAHEPIVVARKPLIGTVAANVLAHGTGALNIDGCRVESGDTPVPFGNPTQAEGWRLNKRETDWKPSDIGRWPANLIHDGSDEVLAAFPQAPGQLADASTSDTARAGQNVYGAMRRGPSAAAARDDLDKSAARFFYCAKSSKKDRNEGLESFIPATTSDGRAVAADNACQRGKTERANTHPTVKPTDLMAYLVRLVTPPGGTVLDPFTGSGSTGKACMREGFNFVGCELSPEYLAIAKARIEREQLQAAMRDYDAMLKVA